MYILTYAVIICTDLQRPAGPPRQSELVCLANFAFHLHPAGAQPQTPYTPFVRVPIYLYITYRGSCCTLYMYTDYRSPGKELARYKQSRGFPAPTATILYDIVRIGTSFADSLAVGIDSRSIYCVVRAGIAHLSGKMCILLAVE